MRSFRDSDICLDFHMLLSMRKAALAFPILALTSQSVPPFVSTTLYRYTKDSTSCNTSPCRIIMLFFLPLIVVILVFTSLLFEYNRYLSSRIIYHSFCNNKLFKMDAESYSVVHTEKIFRQLFRNQIFLHAKHQVRVI